MNRAQLNAEHYQQGVKFAEHFANEDKREFLAEHHHRQAFEQAQFECESVPHSPRKPIFIIGSLALVAVLVISGLFYWQTGRYLKVEQGEQAHTQFLAERAAENKAQRNDHYIVNLQNQLRENPNNGELWFELGQAYSLNNDFGSATICYNNALSVLGRKAAIIGAMATADYYQNKQKLSEQAKIWITEALTLSPKESASLLLLASEAFLNNEFEQAMNYWEQVLDSENPAIDRREIIQSIKMAAQMAKAKKL